MNSLKARKSIHFVKLKTNKIVKYTWKGTRNRSEEEEETTTTIIIIITTTKQKKGGGKGWSSPFADKELLLTIYA